MECFEYKLGVRKWREKLRIFLHWAFLVLNIGFNNFYLGALFIKGAVYFETREHCVPFFVLEHAATLQHLVMLYPELLLASSE